MKSSKVIVLVLFILNAIEAGSVCTAGHYRSSAVKSDWSSKWIWPTLEGKERNAHVYFRRTFALDEVPKEPVEVLVSAATHYTLYVNGRRVGFGPPISDKRYHYYDSRDIQPYLQQGRNVIAAHVHSLATGTEDFHGGRGLFILEGNIPQSNEQIILDTDKSWKCLVSAVWRPDSPRQSLQLHFVEIADLRREPVGWNSTEFDDSRWPSALEIGLPPQGGYVNLVARDLGEFDEKFLAPVKVLKTAEVQRQTSILPYDKKINIEEFRDDVRNKPFPPGINPAVDVQVEDFLPAETVKFENINSLTKEKADAQVTTTAPDKDAAIVLDMGKIVIGCPVLEVEATAGTVIDVSISEILRNGRVLARRPIAPNFSTYLTDRIILRDGLQRWQRNDYNGYRYIQLTIRNATKPLTIRRVGTVLRIYRFANEASFSCSDEMLTHIFDVAKWSHIVNTHWGYCGSSWREHAQWSDMVWPALNLVVFHDAPQMHYYLHQVTLSQDSKGRMVFPYPGITGVELPEQTMWLADDLWKCWLYFKDKQTLHDLFATMDRANDWFKKHITENGLITTADWGKEHISENGSITTEDESKERMWLVVDWGYPYVNNTSPGELATLNLFYYNFLRCLQNTAQVLGKQEECSRFKAQADTLQQVINETFFSVEQGRYHEKPGRNTPSAFASTLAVLYDVVPEEHRSRVFDFAVGQELRAGECSPWFMYIVLEAFAKAGRHEDAVRAMNRYWGKYIEKGATTFWELWPITGEDVLPIMGTTAEASAKTIAYSSGPAAYIVRHVLGVRPLQPGFAETLIAPCYSALRSAEGQVPTPMGYVHVKWQQDEAAGKTELQIVVPKGTCATVRVPYCDKQPVVLLDEELLYDGISFRANKRVSNTKRNADYLEFQAGAGTYTLTSSVSGS